MTCQDNRALNQVWGHGQLSGLYTHEKALLEEVMFVLRSEGRVGPGDGSRQRKQHEQSQTGKRVSHSELGQRSR